MEKQIRKSIGIKKLKSKGLNYKEIGDKINAWKKVKYRENMPITQENKLSVKDLIKTPIPFIEKYTEKFSIFKRIFLFIKRLLKM